MKQEGPLAESGGKDAALHFLRYGTAALHAGDWRVAQRAFEHACRIMDNFSGGGEFRAIMLEEAEKEYRGEPYEQMLAFLYLGLIDLGLNDYENALAAFKTAALADSGSSEEQFRTDSVLLPWLQAVCYKALREHAESDDAFRLTRKTVVTKRIYRTVHASLSEAYSKAADEKAARKDRAEWLAAYDLLKCQLGPVTLRTEYPAEVSELIVESAKALIREKRFDGLSKETAHVLKKHGDAVAAKVDGLHSLMQIKNRNTFDEQSDSSSEERMLEFIDACAAIPQINLLVCVQAGKGPYKYSTGRYGSELRIGRASKHPPTLRMQVNAGDSQLLGGYLMEDVGFQAATRGGRAIDDILTTKANIKLALRLISYLPYAGMAGTIGSLIEAKADTRHWEFLPAWIYVATGHVAAGFHQLEISAAQAGSGRLTPVAKVGVEIPSHGLKVIIIRDEPGLHVPVVGDGYGDVGELHSKGSK